MAMTIDADQCIACGLCEPDCPTGSITVKRTVYKIDANSCTECDGDYKTPHCVELCPIDGCITKLS